MNIIDEIEEKYRSSSLYGVQFSIDASAYECSLGERVSFGDNTTSMQHGEMYNWQDVILDGKIIGFLEEVQSGKLLHPMTISFYLPLDDKDLNDEVMQSPHFYSDEWNFLKFATLNQLISYLNVS